MRQLYTLVMHLLLPVALLRLLLRGTKEPGGIRRVPERLGFTPKAARGRGPIWIHGASVGETQGARALVAALARRFPGCPLLVTTVTATGARHAQQVFAGQANHLYLPYDLPWAAQAFLSAVQPRLLIVMETEIWPNLLRVCQSRGVPAALVNGRVSDRSYRGYAFFRGFMAEALGRFSFIAAQSAEDARRFRALGAPPEKVSVMGNLKFDLPPPAGPAAAADIRERVLAAAERPVWIAASTHAGEEALVLEALGQLQDQGTDCLLVLAPRRPERFDKVFALCQSRGFAVARRAKAPRAAPGAKVYLLDTIGDLESFYGAADLAFVGGSLIPHGGHNMLEAARWGLPIITGPHTSNFREVVQLLKEAGALAVVSDGKELAAVAAALLADPALRRARGAGAKQVVERHRGALEKVMGLLEPLAAPVV